MNKCEETKSSHSSRFCTSCSLFKAKDKMKACITVSLKLKNTAYQTIPELKRLVYQSISSTENESANVLIAVFSSKNQIVGQKY